MLRTHTCGELREKDIKKEVELAGWVQVARDHGGVIFVDLRDRWGITQVVFDPSVSKKCHSEAEGMRREDCILIKGKVRARDKDLVNKKIDTGKIEVVCERVEFLSRSETPPIEIDDKTVLGEDVRLRYRYLDLRRPSLQKRIIIRSKLAATTREYLLAKKFIEVETPLLMKSTPEGARDYIVPSRVHKGKFYALPQSPQIYKQILMVSGLDRYFQIVKCLRDEDLRQDRQPEFTQIDVEMSFVTVEDVLEIGEGLLSNIVKTARDVKVKTPFQRLTYKESMEKYGCDKPDTRFEMFLADITEIVAASEFRLAKLGLKNGGLAKCLAPNVSFTRNELDSIIEYAKQCGAKGLAWMKVTKSGDSLESNIAKFFSSEQQKSIINLTKAKPENYVLIVSDKAQIVNDVLSRVRLKIAKDKSLIDEKKLNFCWVVDFPLFEWDEENKCFAPAHHMFCQPKDEWIEKIEKEPENVLCTQYDLVLNGVEIGSGSIRIIDPEIQERVMKVIGLKPEEIKQKFGFLLEAFKYGPPPHGGFAMGFDRIVALMLGTNDIREVIAFPKTKSAENLMDGSPSIVDSKQLKELGLNIKKP